MGSHAKFLDSINLLLDLGLEPLISLLGAAKISTSIAAAISNLKLLFFKDFLSHGLALFGTNDDAIVHAEIMPSCRAAFLQ